MKKAYDFLYNYLKPGDSLVAAVSGGPDSMALLDILINVRKVFDIQIICAHVNHNLRKESYDEKIMVENYCNENNIIFESMIIEKYGDNNFHNEARVIRYNFFEDIVKKYNSNYLLTAHHGDDLVETVLMRIVRGSSLKGYSGFSSYIKRDNYVMLRPLIDYSKDEILEYVLKNEIPYAIDKSNMKDVYTRNRFRKYVVPELKKEESNLIKKINKYSKLLIETDEYITKHAIILMNEIYKDNKLDLNKFKRLDHVVAIRVIYLMLEHIYKDDISLISDIHLDSIYDLSLTTKPNLSINLPLNIIAKKNYDYLEIKDNVDDIDNYNILINDYVELPNNHIIEKVDYDLSNSNFVCKLNSEEIKLPLYVRNKKVGDRIYIKGMNGSKKVKDIFINEKIDLDERKNWPVVLDSRGDIVWLPGLKKSKFDKTNEEKYDIILKYR